MLGIEGAEGGVQPNGALGNQGIQEIEVVAETRAPVKVHGLVAFYLSRPVDLKAADEPPDHDQFASIAAARHEFHGDQARKSGQLGQCIEPGQRQGKAAGDINADIGIQEEHGSVMERWPPGPSFVCRIRVGVHRRLRPLT